MIRFKRWRAPDGALRVTATGLSCPRGYEGAATGKVVMSDELFDALVPDALTGEWVCAGWGRSEDEAAKVIERAMTCSVGCWSDGSLVLHDAVVSAAETEFSLEMLRRERAGLPVFWSEESREGRRAA